MSSDAGPSAAEIEQTVRSTLSARARLTAADRAHRSGLLRTPGMGLISGVCAAIAASIGVPARLVRLTACVMALLGVGLVIYPVLMLTVPRVGRSDEIETPLTAMARGRVRTMDVLAILAIPPALLLGGGLLLVHLTSSRVIPALLVFLLTLLLAVLLLAAYWARRARRSLLMAALARRAGIADDDALDQFLAEQQRRAPHAWDALAGGGSAFAPQVAASKDAAEPQVPSTEPAPRDIARRERLRRKRLRRNSSPPARIVLALLAGTVAVGALVLLVLNLQPHMLPTVAQDPTLPQVGRVTAALAAMAAVLGLALMVIGWRGKRSIVLGVIGVLVLTGAGLGGGFLRVVHQPGTEPIVIAVTEVKPNSDMYCPTDVGSLGRDVVIDMSDLTIPDPWPVYEDELLGEEIPVPAMLSCWRTTGNVTVILPPDPSQVYLDTSSDLGTIHGESPSSNGYDSPVTMYVYLTIGDIYIEHSPQPEDTGTGDDATEGS